MVLCSININIVFYCIKKGGTNINIHEIELDDTEPSLDEIKKLADSKRPYKCKTYTREHRIKNLELARQKKKNQKLPKPDPEPKFKSKSKPKSE